MDTTKIGILAGETLVRDPTGMHVSTKLPGKEVAPCLSFDSVDQGVCVFVWMD